MAGWTPPGGNTYNNGQVRLWMKEISVVLTASSVPIVIFCQLRSKVVEPKESSKAVLGSAYVGCFCSVAQLRPWVREWRASFSL